MSRSIVRRRGRLNFLLAALVLFLLIPQLAQPQYTLDRSVLGNGAVAQGESAYWVLGTLGQATIGPSCNASYHAKFGFWYLILSSVVTDVEGGADVPSVFRLDQNAPNPFNPTTTIRFALPESEKVTLKIYDIIGREIATLVDQELPAGGHSIVLKPERMASGVYFYRIEAGTFLQSKRMVLVK